MVFSEARHYSGSQMIALAVTTGQAARLWPLLGAWLGEHIRCSKWRKKKSNVLFLNTIFFGGEWGILKEPFLVRNPACLHLLTISSISVPAGQSRHACRAIKTKMTSMLYACDQWDPSADLFQAQITSDFTSEGAVKPASGVTAL